MKKTFKFFAAALAIVAAASCTKEISNDDIQVSEQENNMVEVTFGVALETPVDPTTKTTLASDGLTVHWSENDKIMVFPYKVGGGDNESPYKSNQISVVNESILGGSAKFSGQAEYASNYVAIYPHGSIDKQNSYNNRWQFQNETLRSQTVIPQNFPVVSWGAAHIAMATSCQNGTAFSMNNCLAYVKFTLGYDNIYSIEFSADAVSFGADRSLNSSMNLGGQLYYRPQSGKFDINQGDKPIIAKNNNQPFEKGVAYYIALPPVEIQGFSMTAKDAAGNVIFTKTRSKNLNAQSNDIYNLGHFGEVQVGENVPMDFSTPIAEHVYEDGILMGTRVKFKVWPGDSRAVNDFMLKATLDDGRTITVSNPNTEVVLEYQSQESLYYLTQGTHTISCTYDVNGNKDNSKTLTFNVTAPTFSVNTEFANSYSYYLSKNLGMANSVDSKEVKLNRTKVGIASQLATKFKVSYKVEFQGTTYTSTTGNTYSIPNTPTFSLSPGKYLLKSTATFDGVSISSDQYVYMTGLPIKSVSRTLNSNDEYTISTVYAPSDINVDVNLDAVLHGYNGKSYITYTLYLGDQTFSETTNGYDASRDKAYSFTGTDVVLKPNSVIKMKSEINGSEQDRSVAINNFDVLYR